MDEPITTKESGRLFSEFISKVADSSSHRDNVIAALKAPSPDSNRPLPVVLYGAAGSSVRVEKFLNKNGISVDGFFVDGDPASHSANRIGLIKTIDEICETYKSFNVVLAAAVSPAAAEQKLSAYRNVNAVYDIGRPFDIDNDKFNNDYITANLQKYEAVYEMLSDDFSKKVFIEFLSAKLFGNERNIQSICTGEQYFQSFLSLSSHEVFVDGGAYQGDTLAEFIKVTGCRYEKYFAFEPDAANMNELRKFVEVNEIKNVTLIQKGLWCKPDVLSFSDNKGGSSSITDNSETKIHVDSVDNVCPDATFIKMDIEGAELQAIKGCAQTIAANKPKLAICVYHRPDDILEIPLFIKELVPEYKLFLRIHAPFSSECVLYATV